MKYASFILALLVVLLTAQPAIVLASGNISSDCCGSHECDDEKESTKIPQKPNGKCEDGNCNPFQACGCSLGFTPKNTTHSIQSPPAQKTKLVLTAENSTSQYFPDVWQPPKIA